MLTAAIAGLAAVARLGFRCSRDAGEVGSIVSATDGAAIFGLLRDSSLRPRIARTLEGEAGVNDPIAVLLVVGLIDWIELPDYGLGDMTAPVPRELGIGLAVGIGCRMDRVQGAPCVARRRVRLRDRNDRATAVAFARQQPAAPAFSPSTSRVSSSAPSRSPRSPAVTLFHQGLAQVSQVAMFVVLGLLVFPSQLGDVALEGTLLALVLMLVARPAATFLATLPFGSRFASNPFWPGGSAARSRSSSPPFR